MYTNGLSPNFSEYTTSVNALGFQRLINVIYSLNLQDKVDIKGKVNTSKKGTYELVYSVVDSNNVTITKTRKVIVMDAEINLSLSTSGYTNGSVLINVGIIDEYFDYLILPNNQKVTKSSYEYEVTANGKYKFIVYNKKGMSKEASIEVKNIDKTAPTGSCKGSYKDGKSTINITANDNVGIKSYEYNGKVYTSKTITINNEIKTANIKIYDKAGNTKSINCNLEDKNDKIFDKNITYTEEYVYKSNGVSYVLHTPSTATKYDKIPLIIWLHGSGSRGKTAKHFSKYETMGALIEEWKLDNFNAYILSPHISKETTSSWGSGNIKEKFYVILNEILQTKNIDTNKLQSGITSMQKAIGLFSEMLVKDNPNTSNYTPRPIYRKFDD